MHPHLPTILSLTALATASPNPPPSRLTAPPGCLTVGYSGTYTTIQSAIDALSATTTTSPQCIFIARGNYNEQLLLPPLTSPLTIYGETPDTTTPSRNAVTIQQNDSQTHSPHNDDTATVRAHTPNLRLYNLNIWNTRGRGSQALALSARADKQGYYGCSFVGYQDTIMAQDGAQVYAASRVQGATDFLFGLRGRAWFDALDIRVVGGVDVGYVTASGRDADTNPSYFVINNSSVSALEFQDVVPGAYFLGRPWRDHARVVVQGSRLSGVVNAKGWTEWSDKEPRTEGVLFGEFGNEGEGAEGERVPFAKKLEKPVGIEEVLGEDWESWVDVSYLS